MPDNSELSEDLLTLEDVAILLSHTDQLPASVVRKLPRVIGTHPGVAGHVERLRAMAREAGVGAERGDWSQVAFYSHQDLDRLLAAEDWQDPAEVLDPQGEVGVSYRELVCVAEARARGSRDPRLGKVHGRLQRALAAEAERAVPIRRIAAELQQQEPGAARQILDKAFAEYRRRCRPGG